jgi:hypothetical protein
VFGRTFSVVPQKKKIVGKVHKNIENLKLCEKFQIFLEIHENENYFWDLLILEGGTDRLSQYVGINTTNQICVTSLKFEGPYYNAGKALIPALDS